MPEGVIVPDSSPLIGLARIDQLDLLPKLYSKILVPPAVWDEVTIRGIGRPGAHEVSQVKWIEKQNPDPVMAESLSIMIDRGEAEVIALGRNLANCTLLLDDSHARRVAERFNIPRIGTVGVLRRAKQAGLIDKLRPYLNALVENSIYIRQKLIDAVLKDVGE